MAASTNSSLIHITRMLQILPGIVFLWISCLACDGKEATVNAEQKTTFTILLQGEHITSEILQQRSQAPPPEKYRDKRNRMVERQIQGRGVSDEKTLQAMKRVPRHEFVSELDVMQAYNDHPLPIGHGQTISQPYIVGYMTEILQLDDDDTVLEIGTGSGYQAAVLGEIVPEVVTIEIVEPLARKAAARLKEQGYKQITVIHGDGYFGWEKKAPYDAIIVTAAAEHIPPPLIKQLKKGGRMIIPVGRSGWNQYLILVAKDENGEIQTREVMAVRFVPLTRQK